MVKETTLHITIAFMCLLLAVAARILPGMGLIPGLEPGMLERWLLTLFFTVFTAVLSGGGYAVAVGLLAPLAAFFLLQEGTFRDAALPEMAANALAGLTASIMYRTLKTAFGAALTGLLANRLGYTLTRLLNAASEGRSYTLEDVFREEIRAVWPGFLLVAVGLPALILIFRKIGVMRILRGERQDEQ